MRYTECGECGEEVPCLDVKEVTPWSEERKEVIREHQKSLLKTLYEEEGIEWNRACSIVENEFGPEYMGAEGEYDDKWV